MTPLNSIIGNSKIALCRFLEFHTVVKNILSENDVIKDILAKNKETASIIKSIN